MKQSSARPFDHFIHPFVFVLKEGHQINQDFLDYSLLLLQVGQADVLHSPRHYRTQKTSNPTVQLLKKY